MPRRRSSGFINVLRGGITGMILVEWETNLILPGQQSQAASVPAAFAPACVVNSSRKNES
jgi:hypothetical protein